VSRACPICRTSYPDAAFFCGNDGSITLEEPDGGRVDPRIGQQLGGYLVVARVADGAMGRVYEGRHPSTRARVAIKVLHDQVAKDRVSVERFKREYETAREVNHPNIVKVLEFGETPDRSLFMTMEYLEGRELSKALAGKQSLPKATIVRVLAQTAIALEHAHSFGFIHRDLKPDNIFLCDTPAGVEVRMLDFGSVKLQMETGPKLTALGTTLGSPYYMSPEQALGQADVDQRSDVFAFGAILWEMVTGHTAFEGPTVAAILSKILNESPAPASSLNRESPIALDDVIDKAIRKDKLRRYETARALAEAALAAYGLRGALETWAKTPDSEIAVAVGVAVPPAPKPFGSSVGPGTPAAISMGAVSAAAAAVTARERRAATLANKAGASAADDSNPGHTPAAFANDIAAESPASFDIAGLQSRNKLWLGVGVGILVAVALVVLLLR
jgi:serine/threonine protein kinase